MNKAPWPDFAGNAIHAGDTIRHAGGQRGTVIFLDNRKLLEDQWRVVYEDGTMLRLRDMINAHGGAVALPTELHGASTLAEGFEAVKGPLLPNTICFIALPDGGEMMRISPEGFWVRGEKVPQDEREAKTVYDAFVAWLRAAGY